MYYSLCDLLIPANVNEKNLVLDDMINIDPLSVLKNSKDKTQVNGQQESGICSIDINTLNLSPAEDKIAEVESIFFSSLYVV